MKLKERKLLEKGRKMLRPNGNKPRALLDLDLIPLGSEGDEDYGRVLSGERQFQYESFERLKKPLDTIWSNCMLKSGGSLRSLLFTGAALGQGVTFVSFHLALFLAMEFNVKVLYLDAVLEKKMLGRVFKDKNKYGGLSSHFMEGRPMDELIYRTNVSTLHVLPSGIGDKECITGNIIAKGDILGALTRYCHDKYDVTIFDCQPVLVAPWVIGLAQLIDHVVLVCRYANARREVARVVVDKLEENGVPVGGVVLNDRQLPVPKLLYDLMK